MPDINTMTKQNFVTCDLLDANPESQVCLPNIEGKSFYSFGAKTSSVERLSRLNVLKIIAVLKSCSIAMVKTVMAMVRFWLSMAAVLCVVLY